MRSLKGFFNWNFSHYFKRLWNAAYPRERVQIFKFYFFT